MTPSAFAAHSDAKSSELGLRQCRFNLWYRLETMSEDKKQLIKKQVEYYFSDKNLENDAFFHNKISGDKDGWVDLSFIMNCNKIKQLSEDVEEVIEAIKDSTEVEADKGILVVQGFKFNFHVSLCLCITFRRH